MEVVVAVVVERAMVESSLAMKGDRGFISQDLIPMSNDRKRPNREKRCSPVLFQPRNSAHKERNKNKNI